MPPTRLVSYLILGLLTLIWGTTWAAIRVGLEGVPPFTGVALRFAIAGAVLLPLAWGLGVRLGRSAVERRLWLVNGLCTFCGSYGIVYWAEQWVPSGLAAVLFAVFPLIVAVLAHFAVPGERLTVRRAVGVALGFAGIAVLFSGDFAPLGGRQARIAAAVLLLAPLVSAIAQIAIKRWGAGIHPLSLTAVPMLLTGGIMGAVAAAVERGRPVVFDGPSVAALLYLALVGSALAFSLYFWLLQHLAATHVALVAYTAPVLAVIVGAVALDEPVTLRALAGAALVVAGVALALRAPAR
ncbi:MAG TPA: EamA family transporter [Thermoanaerobaculia bacterium]|nr:EamA family transporter [Thermoanaerobaculia bacterium]